MPPLKELIHMYEKNFVETIRVCQTPHELQQIWQISRCSNAHILPYRETDVTSYTAELYQSTASTQVTTIFRYPLLLLTACVAVFDEENILILTAFRTWLYLHISNCVNFFYLFIVASIILKELLISKLHCCVLRTTRMNWNRLTYGFCYPYLSKGHHHRQQQNNGLRQIAISFRLCVRIACKYIWFKWISCAHIRSTYMSGTPSQHVKRNHD